MSSPSRRPDGTFTVGAGEAFVVPRDAPNKAVAAGDGRTRFVAIGAPKADDAAVSREACPVCGDLTGRGTRRSGDEVVLTYEACGSETARFGPGPGGD